MQLLPPFVSAFLLLFFPLTQKASLPPPGPLISSFLLQLSPLSPPSLLPHSGFLFCPPFSRPLFLHTRGSPTPLFYRLLALGPPLFLVYPTSPRHFVGLLTFLWVFPYSPLSLVGFPRVAA